MFFRAAAPEPRSIAEVLTRHKDLMYASRSREHIEACCRMRNLGRAVRALYERIPKEIKDDPELRGLAELGCDTTVSIVRLAYPAQDWEQAAKDIDFSWTATRERWDRGCRDATHAIQRAAWLNPLAPLRRRAS